MRSGKRWIEAADFRHAMDGVSPHLGDVVGTLCGLTVTVVQARPGRYAAECVACDREWRIREGIPQRPDVGRS
jgi:hypothetical protein